MSLADWRTALAIVLAAVVWTQAGSAGERETSRELVLRSLGHIERDELSAVVPLFAPDSLQASSLNQLVGAFQLLGIGDEIKSRFVTEESSQSPEGDIVDTIVYHLIGQETALLAAGQVLNTETGAKLLSLSLKPAPLELSELNPFVLTNLSDLHKYILVALFCVPGLMLYATVQCLRRESGVGWAWIPFILIGIGRATAVWVPGPPKERLFSFVPIDFVIPGVWIERVANFEPWEVSVSAPLGAIAYLWWSGRTSRTRVEAADQPDGTPSSLPG